MDRASVLNEIIARYDLNKHPFYQDWRMGKLPVVKLQDYASEYGRFIETIALGWETLGYTRYAAEEREHVQLWDDFKKDVQAQPLISNPQTDVLVNSAERFFESKPEAAGALYAFEAQQPHTSRSKLDGLNEHYNLSQEGKEYFVVHADDTAEPEELLKYMLALPEADFAKACSACNVVCAAMWSALDGVYYDC